MGASPDPSCGATAGSIPAAAGNDIGRAVDTQNHEALFQNAVMVNRLNRIGRWLRTALSLRNTTCTLSLRAQRSNLPPDEPVHGTREIASLRSQ
jgi:hypothetical protein